GAGDRAQRIELDRPLLVLSLDPEALIGEQVGRNSVRLLGGDRLVTDLPVGSAVDEAQLSRRVVEPDGERPAVMALPQHRQGLLVRLDADPRAGARVSNGDRRIDLQLHRAGLRGHGLALLGGHLVSSAQLGGGGVGRGRLRRRLYARSLDRVVQLADISAGEHVRVSLDHRCPRHSALLQPPPCGGVLSDIDVVVADRFLVELAGDRSARPAAGLSIDTHGSSPSSVGLSLVPQPAARLAAPGASSISTQTAPAPAAAATSGGSAPTACIISSAAAATTKARIWIEALIVATGRRATSVSNTTPMMMITLI